MIMEPFAFEVLRANYLQPKIPYPDKLLITCRIKTYWDMKILPKLRVPFTISHSGRVEDEFPQNKKKDE